METFLLTEIWLYVDMSSLVTVIPHSRRYITKEMSKLMSDQRLRYYKWKRKKSSTEYKQQRFKIYNRNLVFVKSTTRSLLLKIWRKESTLYITQPEFVSLKIEAYLGFLRFTSVLLSSTYQIISRKRKTSSCVAVCLHVKTIVIVSWYPPIDMPHCG